MRFMGNSFGRSTISSQLRESDMLSLGKIPKVKAKSSIKVSHDFTAI